MEPGTYLPTHLPTSLPTYLPACLSSYLLTYLSTYLPTYIPKDQVVFGQPTDPGPPSHQDDLADWLRVMEF
jgi:hypothetical protein